MIITVTCNPAIDITYLDNQEIVDIGGKGINVSKVLHNLGCKSLLTGFIGKDNKDTVLNDLKEYETHFIEVDGFVRTNKKKMMNDVLIEENEDGPFIPIDKQKELYDYLSNFKNEIVVISGSISSNVNKDYYQKLVSLLKSNNNYCVVDCANELLVNAVNAKPNVIKPNKKEICELFSITYDEELIINKSKELIKEGVETIVISLGEDGSIFLNGNDVYKVDAIKGEVKSLVGAGDAMVAGLAYSKENDLSFIESIKLSVACASAATRTSGTKPPKLSDIQNLINSVIIRKN